MKAVIATWPRRIALAVVAWIVSTLMMLALMEHLDHPLPSLLETGDWMKRLVIAPGLMALMVLLSTTALVRPTQAALNPESAAIATSPADESPKPFVAQVVGLIWLNPLQRRDYPTEWQLLWTQGLVKPNKNDDMVRTNAEKYSSLRSIGALVYGNRGTETFNGFYAKYVDKFLLLMNTRYGTNAKYFYTAAPENSKDWREVAGQRIELAIPNRLEPQDAHDWLRKRMKSFYRFGEPFPKTLWRRSELPDVQITQGDANAGFTSLNKALDYLQANPDKSVWVMNWDAPNFPPTDAQINENLVVLFLAGPTFNTEREPLAWIGNAATGDTEAFSPKVGTTRTVQAWKATIDQAARNAGIAVPDIKYIVHDAGNGSDVASTRLVALSQTLTETLPEYDHGKQAFNTAALLGDMGTGSALTDVALAIGRINHFGGNALVAGTTDPRHPVAVVVTPPSKLTRIDPDTDWFRARGENNAYLPWWGRRHDTNYGIQGFSW
ncbi:virulence factor [Burkholderia sp. NLJ2]|uniref:virulence factor n=1 Tax=Burkholderia sp. NLJ2 TaxID=3090699 RepID=UPI003C6C5124